jgi:hypothetical protein
MSRKPPPTIYTCIAEPNEYGKMAIRWACDPQALDSRPTDYDPPRGMVSRSRVAFLYDYDDDDGWSISCRCVDARGDRAGLACQRETLADALAWLTAAGKPVATEPMTPQPLSCT